MRDEEVGVLITGRCYCGAKQISATRRPHAVAYCHCIDCRRVTGAPVAAFAAFDEISLDVTPDEGRSISVNPGVNRTFCDLCGSALTGRYDYLPGMVYVALGLLDQANILVPQLHAHEGQRLEWLHIEDELVRYRKSAQSGLSKGVTS